MDERADAVVVFDHFRDGDAFFGEGAGGARLNALAATGAGFRFAPFRVQITDDAGVNAARGHLPDMGAFQFRANANAAGAKDAAVVVENVAGMREIDRERRVIVRKMHGTDAEGSSHGLKFTVTVGNTDGADVIALDEQEFDGDAAILSELGGIRGDGHTVLNGRGTGGQETVDALNFDDAEATRTDGGKALEITKSGDVLAAGLGRLQDGLAFEGADQLAVNAYGQFFLRQVRLLSLSDIGNFQIAAQAAAGFVHGLFVSKSGDNFGA